MTNLNDDERDALAQLCNYLLSKKPPDWSVHGRISTRDRAAIGDMGTRFRACRVQRMSAVTNYGTRQDDISERSGSSSS